VTCNTEVLDGTREDKWVGTRGAPIDEVITCKTSMGWSLWGKGSLGTTRG
jgi:hypothetical protein